MAKTDDTPSMAVFCDFENVALGVRDAKYERFDIRKVLERLLLKGSIVVKKAYCDWDRYREFKAPMHEASFELIEIPHVRQSGKNSADIRMVVDALDLCYTKSHVDTFVIVSGDSDFSPLVSKLRENAKTVIGVGVKGSTSDLLTANCDEFIFYDDLVREQRRRRVPRDAGRERDAGRDREGGREKDAARTKEVPREPARVAADAPAGAAAATALPPGAPEPDAPKKRAPRRRKAAGATGAAADDAAATTVDAPTPSTSDASAVGRSPDGGADPATTADADPRGPDDAFGDAPAFDDAPPRAASEAGGATAGDAFADAGGDAPAERRSDEARRQEALDLAVETVEALLAERGADDKIWGSMVKQTLKRRRPGFAESYYGYRSFNELLEDARDRGLLALEHDEKSGGYVIRLL